MMSEAVIQEKILKLLNNNEIYNQIKISDIESLECSINDSDDFLQSFSIDQYIRRRGAISATLVLKSLQFLKVLTADKNVSVAKGQILRPDIVCINPETQTLVIFELKKSIQTERQALTELLAYEHEIKNILPFLSNYDTNFVLISTDWSVLMQHAVGSAIAWSGKNILCLQLGFKDDELDFNIVRSDAWTITGAANFPKSSVSSATVYLYDLDSSVSDDEIKYRSSIALDILSREADRAGLHGYALISEDFSGFNERGILFTICSISPFSFFKKMLNKENVSEEGGHLVREISSFVREYGDDSSMSSLLDVVLKFMYPILNTFCNPQLEGFHEWEYSKSDLECRGLPFEMEFWGIPGEYARNYVINPAVTKHKNNTFPAGRTYWRSPLTGLLLINNLYRPTFLEDGRFRPSDALRLGLVVGADFTLRKNLKANPQKKLECLFFFNQVDLLNYLDEIFLYVNDANGIGFPNSILEFCPDVEKEVEWSSFIEWVMESVFNCEETYCYLFDLGLQMSLALRADNLSSREEFENFYSNDVNLKLCSFVAVVIERAISDFSFNEILKKYTIENIKSKLNVENFSFINKFLEGLPLNKISFILEDVFVLANLLIPAVAHTFKGVSPMIVDWDYLKQGVDGMYDRGVQYPAIFLNANGAIGTSSFDGIGYAILKEIEDRDVEVYVSDASSGIQQFYIARWEELRNGKLIPLPQNDR